jgi:hypothetical protein
MPLLPSFVNGFVQISAVCTGGTCYVVMAQDFTSFVHGNTVFREKNRHKLVSPYPKPLVASHKAVFLLGKMVTNLSGTSLNVACNGSEGASPMEGTSI